MALCALRVEVLLSTGDVRGLKFLGNEFCCSTRQEDGQGLKAALEKCLFPGGNKNVRKKTLFFLTSLTSSELQGFSSGPSLCSNHHVHLLINLCASRKDFSTLAMPTEKFWPIKPQFLDTRQEKVVPWWSDRSKQQEVPNQALKSNG